MKTVIKLVLLLGLLAALISPAYAAPQHGGEKRCFNGYINTSNLTTIATNYNLASCGVPSGKTITMKVVISGNGTKQLMVDDNGDNSLDVNTTLSTRVIYSEVLSDQNLTKLALSCFTYSADNVPCSYNVYASWQ